MGGSVLRTRMRRMRALILAAAVLASLVVPAVTSSDAAAPSPTLLVPAPYCPGVSDPLWTSSFPPGTYDLSSDYVTFSPNAFTIRSDNTMTPAVTVTIHNDAPDQFDVDATAESAGAASYPSRWTLNLIRLGHNIDDGAYSVTGSCLGPGDTVDLSSDAANAVVPSSVTAGLTGDIAVDPRVAAKSTRTTFTLSATDAPSGRTASATFPIPATTLPTGARLSSTDVLPEQMLYSPNLTYRLSQYGCTTELTHFYRAGGQPRVSSVWWHGTGNHLGSCRLTLLSTGDLVLRQTSSGTRVWHTGTATTGSNNRLVVQNNGNLVLRTAAGDPVWSSRTGLIRGPLGYTTRARITRTRFGSTDHLTGRVRQFTIDATLVPGVGRAVTLQRAPLRGSWHDYRTKTADTTGHVHFNVAHCRNYLYRLAVDPTRRLAPALSSPVQG